MKTENHILMVSEYLIEFKETEAGLEISIANESGQIVADDMMVTSEVTETIQFLAKYL